MGIKIEKNGVMGQSSIQLKRGPDWWPKEKGSLIGVIMEMEGIKPGETEAGDVQIISVKSTSLFWVIFRSFSMAFASI
jgi:hypothetical protein